MLRAFRGKCLSLGVAVSAAVVFSAGARAGDLFVMPYACSAPGGQPVLTPSSDQGYAVIGRKEQRPFSACSPSNPDVCKQWTVYRFDISCGGTRVSWVDVAAAVSATRNGRAFADHGRLRIEMPPRWAMSPGDPCSREAANDGEWHGGGFARFCAERRAHARGPIVEIPDGYAPMMGLDAIFVADGAPSGKPSGPNASAEPRPAPFASEPAAASKPPKVAVHPKPVETPSERAAGDAPLPPAPKLIERVEKPEFKPSVIDKSAGTAAAPASSLSPTQPSSATAAPSGTPMMPTVINKPGAPKSPEKPAEPAAATPSTPPAPVEAVPVPKPATPPQHSPIVTASIDAPENDAPKAPVTEVAPLHAGVSSLVTPTTMAGAGLAALALVALAMVQLQNRSTQLAGSARDIATVSFEAPSTARDLIVKPDAAVPAPPNVFVPRGVGNDMPQTREQALDMLGMGVASEDDTAAMKKIVDGLRQSWHPDHARGAADRELRELRTKQINAAWEIITKARSAGSSSDAQARQLPPNAA